MTIEPSVLVNFWGTLATKTNLVDIPGLTQEGYRPGRWYIDIKDDEGVLDEEDETHLFYAADTCDTNIY